MTIPPNGRLQTYLDDLERIQSTMDKTQRQISSGVRVGAASDDPAGAASILSTQASLGMDEQAQANLAQVKAELQAGDSALQQGVKLLDQAITLGVQGASSQTDISQYSVMLQQARAIQESLIGIASTTVNGRYIFSGDHDAQPLYTLDASQPYGVRRMSPAEATLRFVDRDGVEVWRPRTAAEIFDSGSPENGNVFAAVAKLASALSNSDSAAAGQAVAALKQAAEHLNRQLGIYGMAENRVAEAISASARAVVTETQTLSAVRDTDVAEAAMTLSAAGLQQQAALSVAGRISQRSLFDYLA